MSKSRIPTWVSLILLGVGLLALGIPGLFVYMRVTATKVHPDSQKILSVMDSQPPAKWAGAAEQAREIVRTSITENNLAGLDRRRYRRRDRVDGGVWVCGYREALARDSQSPLSNGNRFHRIHIGCHWPAVGRGPVE